MPRRFVLSFCKAMKGDQALDAEKRALAIFDFDGTMIKGDSIVAYVKTAARRKKVPAWRLGLLGLLALPYYMGFLTDERYKQIALSFYGKLTPGEQAELDCAFAGEDLLPRVYGMAQIRLEERKKEGCLCLMVSASTENYMRLVSRALGFDALLCTPLGGDGKIGRNCKGDEKARRLREYLEKNGIAADFASSYAYADGKSDLPILCLCGRAVQVNPKRALRKAAPGMAYERWV